MASSDARDPLYVDEDAIDIYRLARIRQLLANEGLAGTVVTDPINLRYATGTRNMQVWTMHNLCRYAFIATDGPVVMFELASATHMSEGRPNIDEIRPAIGLGYMLVGPRNDEMAARWAAEIADLVSQHGAGCRRLGIDRADLAVVRALEAAGLEAVDAKPVMEHARAIKSPEELLALQQSLATCEASIAAMRAALHPGMTEAEALGILLRESVSRGGEYPETRLLTAGPRTNPWFQETSDRIMRADDMLSFDTDLIGPMGFYNDISRSWVVGGDRPSDEQRRLYDLARRQLEHNTELLRPGTGFAEYAEKAFVLPDAYLANRYADVAHGCGLGVEYPLIWYPEDTEWGAYDGVFEEDMVVCVESYIGEVDGDQGVKLEQPIWISADGPVVLSSYPLEDEYA